MYYHQGLINLHFTSEAKVLNASKDKLPYSLWLHQWKRQVGHRFCLCIIFLERQRFNMGHRIGIRRLSWLKLSFSFELVYLKCCYSKNQQDLLLKNIFPQRRTGWPPKTIPYDSGGLDACGILCSYWSTFLSYRHKLWCLFSPFH